MKKIFTPPELKKQMRHIQFSLIIEIVLTICIAFSVFYMGWNNIASETKQYTSNICLDLNTTINGYTNTFSTMIIPIKEKIAENPSFDESEFSRFENYLSPEAIKRDLNHQFEILAQRFFMQMQDKDGTMCEKTIEISKIAFVTNNHDMVTIALRDASESVDLLKAALRETEQAKKEKAEEYDRFMGYICTAVDLVTELNIHDRIMTKYAMVDGNLVIEQEGYPDDKWLMFHPDDIEQATIMADYKKSVNDNLLINKEWLGKL